MRVTVRFHEGDFGADGWARFLDPGEVLRWTGRPAYGRKAAQVVGTERVVILASVLAAAAMWATLPFLSPGGSLGARDAVWVYGAVTLGLVFLNLYRATARADVMNSLFYAVTDRRALVCLEGYGPGLGLGCHLVACQPTPGFRIPVLPDRPYPSLQVGSLLSDDAVQPLGTGLTHPGWSPMRSRLSCPVLFEQVPDYDPVCELIEQAALTAGPWGHRDRR